MARWAPVAAAAAVVVVVGGAAAVLATRPAGPAAGAPASPTTTGPAAGRPTLASLRVRDGDQVTASGTVLAVPGKPVRFCAPAAVAGVGYTGPEPPPDCAIGVDLAGADVGALAGRTSYGSTRWGRASITGRYAAGTVTVTAQGPPAAAADPDTDLPERPPCPAPPGGWRPGALPPAATDALGRMVTDHPAAYGELAITYPDGYPSGPTAAPGYWDATQVALVTTVLDPAEAERQLRAHFAGNLCVRPAPRSRAGTAAVWQRAGGNSGDDGTWRRHQVFEGGPDYLTGRVEIALVVLDRSAYDWLTGVDAGTGAVDPRPWLRPTP